MPDTDQHHDSDAREHLRGELLGLAGGALYSGNPFRRLGLSVLAGNREISKRCDQLRLAQTLQLSDSAHSFALTRSLNEDELRTAAHVLKDPHSKILLEFFWFWPLAYPERDADPALASLALGHREAAVTLWCTGAAAGCPAALHNLALYYHVLALDWETDDLRKNSLDESVWDPALKYWKRVQQAQPLWDRLQSRIDSSGDTALLEGLCQDLRAVLPELLSKTSAELALASAHAGNSGRAALHTIMAERFHDSPAQGLQTLQLSVQPIVRRIDARSDECRARIEARPEQGLREIQSLLADSERDIRVVETFCGGENDLFKELSQCVVTTALDGLVSFQRSTKNDRACLPLLLHLQDRALTPESARRTNEAFEVIYENALGGDASTGRDPAAAFALLIDELLAGELEVDFSQTARKAYRTRLARMCSELADQAHRLKVSPATIARAQDMAAYLLAKK